MKPEELEQYLQNPQGKKVLFRREYGLIPVAPEGTDQTLWNQLVEDQWQALVRDILALANGNVNTANKSGKLIIGVEVYADDEDGVEIYDTRQLPIYNEQVLEKVNQYCEPAIPGLQLERVQIEGKQLIVITIPKSPFIHETNQTLKVRWGEFDDPSGQLVAVKTGEVYSAWTVLTHHGEKVVPASTAERKQILEEKSTQSPYKRVIKGIQENPVISILSFLVITVLPTVWFLWTEVYPTLKPELMSGEFNVAVAEIAMTDENGAAVRGDDGMAVADFLYDRLEADFNALDMREVRYQVWGPEQTGKVKGRTAEERSAAAQELAEKINSHVIVYGVITTGDQPSFSPEFYVDYKGFEMVDDITGEHQLGSDMIIALPFDLTQMQVIQNPALSARANALSLITIGLAYLSVDNASEARNYFQEAEALDGWFKSAGKEVVYLLIGNTYGRQESIEKNGSLLLPAEQAYQTALEINPNYGRAIIGLAGITYLRALGDPENPSFETVDEQLLSEAETLFKEASQMDNAPESANIPVKAASGLGQVYLVKFQQGLGQEWIERAKSEFEKVLAAYENGNQQISENASHAYARLGLIAWQEGDIESAVTFYQSAVKSASPYYQGFYNATIGDIYQSTGMTEQARTAYNEAIRIAEFYGDEESAIRYYDKLQALE